MKTLGNASRLYPPRTLGQAPQVNVAYTDLANIFTEAQEISLASGSIALTLRSASGPSINLDNSTTGVASAEIGQINFLGEDDLGNSHNYAFVDGIIVDPTDGSEDGRLRLVTSVAGVLTPIVTVESGVQIGAPTGGDKGAGTLNLDSQLYKDNVQQTGGLIIRHGRTNYTTYDNFTNIIANDDSIPQITEGDEIAALVVTPRSASSTLIIRVGLCWTTNGATIPPVVGVFQDAIASAIAATSFMSESSTTVVNSSTYEWEIAAGSTSARTYRLRVGPGTAGTVFLNGDSTARQLGGRMQCFLSVDEELP